MGGAGRSDKTNAGEARLLGQAHHIQNLAVGHGLVGPELNFDLGLLKGNSLQLAGQGSQANGLVIDKDITRCIETEADGLGRLTRLGCFGLGEVKSNGTGQQRGRQDENDQQNQHDIDQGRDIDVAKGLGLRRSGKATKSHVAN